MAVVRHIREYRSAANTLCVHDPEVQAFLDALVATAPTRKETIPQGTTLWRAQLGCAWEPNTLFRDDEEDDDDYDPGEHPVAHPDERMIPLRNTAAEGRANPLGIPYLYLATERETAMSEVRPWIGSYVSVARFVTQRSLELVNCSNDRDGKLRVFITEPPPAERERAVWANVNSAFSRPVTLGDDPTAYIPTQIMAELFKAHGYDGVAYESALGAGHNIALFDLGSASINRSFVSEVKSVKFTFSDGY